MPSCGSRHFSAVRGRTLLSADRYANPFSLFPPSPAAVESRPPLAVPGIFLRCEGAPCSLPTATPTLSPFFRPPRRRSKVVPLLRFPAFFCGARAHLALCRPLRQPFLPFSALPGGGRKRCPRLIGARV